MGQHKSFRRHEIGCRGCQQLSSSKVSVEEEDDELEHQLSLLDRLCPSLGYQCDLVLDHLSLRRP